MEDKKKNTFLVIGNVIITVVNALLSVLTGNS